MMRNIIPLVFLLATSLAAAQDGGAARAACRQAIFNGLLAPGTAKFQDLDMFTVAATRDSARMSQVSDWLLGGQGGRAMLALDKRFNLLKADEMLEIEGRLRSGDYPGADLTSRAALSRSYALSEQAVLGYVDAQNAFGAMIRHSFLCLATRRGAWIVDRVVMLP